MRDSDPVEWTSGLATIAGDSATLRCSSDRGFIGDGRQIILARSTPASPAACPATPAPRRKPSATIPPATIHSAWILPAKVTSATTPSATRSPRSAPTSAPATYRLLTLLRVYDEKGRWHGCRSCAHWLSWRTAISLGPAREKVRVARCLPSLPLISGAFAKGEISYSKVRALTRVATTDNEAELLAFADHGTTLHVERMVREWRRLDRSDARHDDPARHRGLSLHVTDDGNYEIRGQLTPEVDALLLKAIETTEDKLYREQQAAGTEHETTAAQRLRRTRRHPAPRASGWPIGTASAASAPRQGAGSGEASASIGAGKWRVSGGTEVVDSGCPSPRGTPRPNARRTLRPVAQSLREAGPPPTLPSTRQFTNRVR